MNVHSLYYNYIRLSRQRNVILNHHVHSNHEEFLAIHSQLLFLYMPIYHLIYSFHTPT